MKVSISSSSSEQINNIYKTSSKEVIKFLAMNNCDLNWGTSSKSIMGICYEEFNKAHRKVYGYNTKLYEEEIKKVPNAYHNIYSNTFDLRKNLYNDADIIVILPGGTGTISELFAFIEEARSNDNLKPIIIYNESKHFDLLLELIKDLIKRNFNGESIYDYFKVANTFKEFKELFYKYQK